MTCPFKTEQISFYCLASSSSGNAYVVVFPENRALMVECGLSLKDLQKAMMDYGLSLNSINACIITHAHKDHSMARDELLERGIDVYGNAATMADSKGEHAHIIEAEQRYKILPNLWIKPFAVVHDTPSFGYLIYDGIAKETIMFINDTRTFDPITIADIAPDYLFIECNHIRKQLEAVLKSAMEKAEGNEDDKEASSKVFKYTRQAHFHLSLAGTKKMIRALNTTKLKGIFLMHLSDEIANEYVMKKEIETTMKIKTAVCGKRGGIK